MQSLSFAKLVATPNDRSWSQVYNAGNLFACLSLSKSEENDSESTLNSTGKNMFSSLESEFFTLEEKSLQSIKEAIANSSHSLPSNIKASLCLVYFKENILYLFTFGKGKIIIKRDGKIGTLLEGEEDLLIKSASGLVKNGDILILETSLFAKEIDEETISKALDLELPNDIAESLSPVMHISSDEGDQSENGSLAAIIIRYQEPVRPDDFEEKENLGLDDENDEATIETLTTHTSYTNITSEEGEIEMLENTHEHVTKTQTESEDDNDFIKPHVSDNKPSFSPMKFIKSFIPKNKLAINHRSKLFLSIAGIILVLLVLSIILTKKKQSDTKTLERFHAVYDPALKDYEDGEGIKSINKEFATADFQRAQKTLNNGKDQFKNSSKEYQQISDLLSKVNSELGGTAQSTGNGKNLDRSKLTLSVLNGSGVPGAAKGISDYLSGLRYTIQTTGNADKYDYKNITIQIKKNADAYLPLLKKDLSEKSSSITATTDEGITTDAVVIVGK